MKTYNYPDKEKWTELIERPEISRAKLDQQVQDIINSVRHDGDEALIRFAEMYDKASIDELTVTQDEISAAKQRVSEELKQAIQQAYDNITTFHKSQLITEPVIETMPGVSCWRKSVAMEKVGLYIPGGSAPLFSTILMLGIPANLVGCTEIVLCTPPNKDGEINPAILFAADLVGVTQICKVGGAQAVAAMAYGTASVKKVDKIFGPGNQYVTKAKQLVQQSGVAVDMPAGPSEVLVIADKTCNPAFVAADLLSQAEHGPDSQVILLTDSETVASMCMTEVTAQVDLLPRKDIASQALENSKVVVLEDLESCLAFSNLYAPEHLILATESADDLAAGVVNAGSVFLGNYSCESAGDYASGTNHTLPTNGYARSYSGVSTDSFVKKITYQKLTPQGIQNIGRSIEIMAEAEGLAAHKNAVTLRLKSLDQ